MNAPDKIYLVKKYNTDDPVDYWYSATTNDTKVEYVRKDAFIEKACEWLKKNRKNYSSNALGEEYLIDDFKKVMKGE